MKNRKGFTLIELLAVITIMGILMLVAIPAVSRTIENSRRDAYMDVVKAYINTVRNAVLADELECEVDSKTVSVGGVPDGTYYFKISTVDGDPEEQQTGDIMESGGYSSWSNSDVKGYVKWVKEAHQTTPASASASSSNESDYKTTTTYYALLVDNGKHGLDTETEEMKITRQKIKTKTSFAANTSSGNHFIPTVGSGSSATTAVECTLK